MRKRNTTVAGAAAVALALSFSVEAETTGEADANAAMRALNAGDYDTAVAKFTSALASNGLTVTEVELAHSARGFAYLNKRDYWAAIADLELACREKPDDADAQKRLVIAIAALQPARDVPGQSAKRVWNSIGQSLLKGAAAGIAQGLSQSEQH